MLILFSTLTLLINFLEAKCPFKLRFQEPNGQCNNLVNFTLGTSKTSYNSFGGIARPVIFSNFNRPNPRVISNTIFAHPKKEILDHRGLSHLCMQWGQFLDHDLTLTPNSGASRVDIPVEKHPLETRFTSSDETLKKIPFTRADGFENNKMINVLTHWLDASVVYGSDDDTLSVLLANKTAKLILDKNGNLAKSESDTPLAGDSRADVQPGLSAIQALLAREHNRIVDIIVKDGMNSDPEIQFNIARLVVSSAIQRITWDQWLPTFLGAKLTPVPYNPYSFPRVARSFAGAAFRVGHSMISDHFDLYNPKSFNAETKSYSLANPPQFLLKDSFFHSDQHLGDKGNDMESVMVGLFTQRMEKVDRFIIDTMRNFLFFGQINFGKEYTDSLDIVSINIQRGRDVALLDFRSYLAKLTGKVIDSWSQLSSDQSLVQKLKTLYNNRLDNIDLFVGLLCEDSTDTSSLPPTLRETWKSQFEYLQESDRFWYSNYLPEVMPTLCKQKSSVRICNLLQSILDGKWGLADIIKANTKIPFVPENPFVVKGFENFHQNLKKEGRSPLPKNIKIAEYNAKLDTAEVKKKDPGESKGEECEEVRCSSSAICYQKKCVCNPGFYGSGKECSVCENIFVNGDFEYPVLPNNKTWQMFGTNYVPGWMSTDVVFEFWTGKVTKDIKPETGNQFIEIASLNRIASVFQVVRTTPGTQYILRFSHRGRDGNDTLAVFIGTQGPNGLKKAGNFNTGTKWTRYTIAVPIPEGQAETVVLFQALSATTPNCPDPCNKPFGNMLDSVVMLPEKC